MKGDITTFWGKLGSNADSPDDGSSRGEERTWHPLFDHCADVAACLWTLLRQDVIRRRLARLGRLEDLTLGQCARLGVLAALHDVGKVNVGFQNRARALPPFTAGHVGDFLALFGAPGAGARMAQVLELSSMGEWATGVDDVEALLIAAVSHHGRPVPVGIGFRPELWRPFQGLDPFAGAAELRQHAGGWFPEAKSPQAGRLPAAPAFQHAFNGLLTLADWLASDEALFPYAELGDPDRYTTSLERAREALERMGLASAPARQALGPGRPSFDRVSPHAPRRLQADLLALPLAVDGGVTVLEAETGAGKTEAALARFLALFQAGLVDGMYFALPTRTAATQIHARVVTAVRLAFPDVHLRPPVVLAVPGYTVVDDQQATRLAPYRVLWPDDDRERWRYRGWAAEQPKRFLAGAVVVGTIDQVLLSSLAVRHAHLRAGALLRHLLVIDEVHASDAYMTRVLEAVLARHLAAGGHALIMSATLGSEARDRLLAPFARRAVRPLGDVRADPYPAITVRNTSSSASEVFPLCADRPRTISVALQPLANDCSAVAALAVAAAKQGARVLVLRNTVAACIDTQRELEAAASSAGAILFRCAGVPAPHHSRFAREDRVALDAALDEAFGREAGSGGCAAVATQTVQQSLDVDADFLVTDLCPMDVLLQRIGRLHRHRRSARPAAYMAPRVVVVVPEGVTLDRFLRPDGSARGPNGLGTVYPDLRILEATWRLLQELGRLDIPGACRRLVEETTHPTALRAVAAAGGPLWQRHESRIMGISSSHAGLADLNLANWDAPFGDPDTLFPSGDLARDIPTRLGEDDRLAVFQPPVPGAFGSSIRELILPAHMVRGAAADAAATPGRATAGALAFEFGGRQFRYDRWGLRPAAHGRDKEEDDGDV